MTLYRIKDWQKLFETTETRRLKSLNWWPKPNKHDGLGFRRMAAERDKVNLYCAWNLLCDLASKTTPQDRRGYLERDGKPLVAEDMAFMTGYPSDIFTRALEFFSSSSVGWLSADSPATPADSPQIPADDAGTPARRQGKEGKEGKDGITRGRGFPASIDDAIQQCSIEAIPKEFVMKCFDKADYRGGLDAKGQVIHDFRGYCRVEYSYERERLEKEKRFKNPNDSPGAQRVAGIPTLAEAHAYAREKWGDEPKHSNWAASFHGFWSDSKRQWKKQGCLIDWKIELTSQVAKWRTQK